MELVRGSFQDENSVPSYKKYHSLAHASKNLYVNWREREVPVLNHLMLSTQCFGTYEDRVLFVLQCTFQF